MNTSLTTTSNKKGFSITALVLGLVAVATGIFYVISLPAGIVGIVFAALSLNKRYAGRGMAIAGLVTAIIGVAFGLLTLTLAIIGLAVGSSTGTNTTY